MPRTVLLEHILPDGSAHFDWLLARAETVLDDDRSLIAFRVDARLDASSAEAVRAERMPDHRGLYLRHEGPVTGNRGTVRRVAEGEATIEIDAPEEFAARVRWQYGARFTVHGSPVCGPAGSRDAWLLAVEPA